jgi:hypothetical protein
MPARDTNDPEHWRKRAAQMRTLAGAVSGEAAILLNDLATDYEKLAVRAANRANGKKPRSNSERGRRAAPSVTVR